MTKSVIESNAWIYTVFEKMLWESSNFNINLFEYLVNPKVQSKFVRWHKIWALGET